MTTTALSRVKTIKASSLLIVSIGLVILTLVGCYFRFSVWGKPALITIVGEGRVGATPQVVKFSVSVTNWADSANIALSENNRLTRKLISLIKEAGVGEGDIKVAYVRVIPPEAQVQPGGYQAVNVVDVVLKDPFRFDGLVGDLYAAGAQSVANIVFLPGDEKDLEKEAAVKAFQNARLQAREIAKAQGDRLGRLVSLEIIEREKGVLSGGIAPEDTFSSAISTSPAQIEVTQRVSAVFELR